MNEVMKLTQYAIIEEQLKETGKEIDGRISVIDSMVINEESRQEAKTLRADLNKLKTDYEDKRKSLYNEFIKPYSKFKDLYDENILNKLVEADKKLKEKINTIEEGIKDEKEKEVLEYFNEYCESENIEFITFDNTNIKVGLSDSMKSLKEKAKEFVEKIVSDVKLINTQEYADEIMIDYKKNLNVSVAISSVIERHKELEIIQNKKEELKEQEEAKETKVKEVSRVVEAETEEPQLKIMTFTVTGTIERLKEIKKFLDEGGYKYE